MPSLTPLSGAGRVAFRCDGNEQIGAGHVARCASLAAAFQQLGWRVSFVGTYEGLALRLLATAGMDMQAPCLGMPCGIAANAFDAAVLDSYLIAPAAICDLANSLPVVTLAEANRCPERGILLDYHLDRTAHSSARLVAGPTFAPLCPDFAGAGRAGRVVRRVLVTFGGSLPALELLKQVPPIVCSVFPDADIVVAGGAQWETDQANMRALALPVSTPLVEIVSDIDLAITAAGLTAYEMACAGIPQAAIGIAPNQRRVVRGLRRSGLAPCLDLTHGDSLNDLPSVLSSMQDVGLRNRLAARGRSTFDGKGAQRAAVALTRCLGAATACDA